MSEYPEHREQASHPFHSCSACGTRSRFDERFCGGCGRLFPALRPVEPVTQEIPRTPTAPVELVDRTPLSGAVAPLEAVPPPAPTPPAPIVVGPAGPVAVGPPAAPAIRRRRVGSLWAGVAAVALVAAVAASAFSLASGPSEEEEVRAVFDLQVDAIRSGRFDAVYARFSPEVRASCRLDVWVAGFDPFIAEGGDLSLLTYRDVEVRVTGDEASVTYDLLYDGRVVQEVAHPDPDRFERIDGRWFDAADPSTACGEGGDPSRSVA